MSYRKQQWNILFDKLEDFIQSRVDLDPFFLTPKLKHTLPDPFIFPGMRQGVERLARALKDKEDIVIFGDYDVDGAATAALLHRVLTRKGASVDIYIPDRSDEGYGPNPKALEYLKEKFIIFVDCATNAFDLLDQKDVIILDHHLSSGKVPQVTALINPFLDQHLRSDLYGLCSCGIAFLFLIAFFKHMGENASCLLNELDLVALATVCDVMPLLGLNRAFVTQGLKIIVAQDKPWTKFFDKIASAEDIAFKIGPRLNAAGRLGSALLTAKLLSTSDEKEMCHIAQKLESLNTKRKYIEDTILREAIEQAELSSHKKAIVVSGDNWHPGVIGIVAARLKDKYNKPAFVITHQTGQGSARSVHGVCVGSLLEKAAQQKIVISGGGHKKAGGFRLHKSNVVDFETFLESNITQLHFNLDVDFVLPLSALSDIFLEKLQPLKPFGQGNKEPLVVLKDVYFSSSTVMAQHHVRCNICDHTGFRVRAVCFYAFRHGLDAPLLSPDLTKRFDVVGHLKDSKQFFIEDIRHA